MDKVGRQVWMAAGLLTLTAGLGLAARGSSVVVAPARHGSTTFVAPASGPVAFSGQLDRTAVLRGGDGTVRLELVMAARAAEIAPSPRVATDLVVVLDRSGSMSGDKMTNARRAVRELIERLGASDRFALVSYADDGTINIPLAAAADGARAAWSASVDTLEPSGSTNMAAGLDLATELIGRSRAPGRVPRIVLISDGNANTGDATREGLTGRARRAAQGEYMLSTVGVGLDFNEDLMSALADSGTGNYYFVHGGENLSEVFAREFEAARATVASGLAVRLEPAPGVQVIDAAGYPLEPDAGAVVFRPGSLFAGQERRVWLSLMVPHETPGEFDLGRFSLSYANGATRTTLHLEGIPRIACVEHDQEYYSRFDRALWGRSVVVDEYNKMQNAVARAVKEGRRDEAEQQVQGFVSRAGSLNQRLQSPEVAAQVEQAARLRADVDAAFTGPNQAERQNELSKTKGLEALDARRAGSKN